MEIKELVEKYEYGKMPRTPDKVTGRVVELQSNAYFAGKGNYEKIQLTASMGQRKVKFPFWFCYQRNKKSVKTVICINFRSDMPDRYVPVEEILDNGWNIATVNYNDITEDSEKIDENYKILRGKESSESAGKIACWAWGAMRVLDYLESREEVDKNNVGVVGHSRLGKTALVVAAFDERFKFVHSNCSGRCGANLFAFSLDTAESVKNITDNFPYWFCKNLKNYADKEKEMPFDQDMLVSAIAPRIVSIGSAEEDSWACPEGEFACVKKASKTWEKITGEKYEFPLKAKVGKNYHTGKIGYYVRKGMHYFSREDWNRFLPFFDKYVKR